MKKNVVLCFLLLLLTPLSFAEVRFFDDIDYQGTSQGLTQGEYPYYSRNDSITSIRIPAGYLVTVYTDGNFGGSSQTFSSDVYYVGNTLNDKISSIKVEAVAIIYEHANFQGNYQILRPNWYDWGQIPNDSVSSIRIPPGLNVTLYGDTHWQGINQTLTSDMAYVGDYINDKTSSIKITKSEVSTWNCLRASDGHYVDRVTITWGHTAGDASWACNNWLGSCGSGGGCTAVGHPRGNPDKCDINTQFDGCSVPFSDSISQYGKTIFRAACNQHDACYRAPWSDYWSGFNTCNDRFWDDMGAVCATKSWDDDCHVIRSVWGSAMNFDPGRTKFSDAYYDGQRWTQGCVR